MAGEFIWRMGVCAGCYSGGSVGDSIRMDKYPNLIMMRYARVDSFFRKYLLAPFEFGTMVYFTPYTFVFYLFRITLFFDG